MTLPAKSSIQGMGIRDARFRTEFVAKTLNPSVPDDRLESFTIPSLMDFTAFDAKEMLLCPVKARPRFLKNSTSQAEC